MPRTLLVCALLFAWPLHVQAQKTVEPTETVIRLTVQPMAAPKPALKYLLLPDLRELHPGNPIHEYTRCFAEQYNFWRNKGAIDLREKYQVMPLNELPLDEVRNYGGKALRYADDAARMDAPNWQILPRMKKDGVATLLPDLQQLRELAAALKVRFRAEVAEKRFDDAIGTAKTIFALSRHIGEHPTLIGDLVGIAIANVAIGPLDEMLQQPGCPNLYWALSDLPNPFISLRNGIQGQRVIFETHAGPVEARRVMTQKELDKLVADMSETLRNMNFVKNDARTWLQSRLENEKHIAAARQRLIDSGLPEERVKVFLPLQVVLLDEKVKLEIRMHDEMKLMTLPFWQTDGQSQKAPETGDLSEELVRVFVDPVGSKVHRAQARLEQRFALLRHVEAIRLYAADHDGKLPASLNDIAVPLPVDPITGQPFRYSVDGPLAEVRGSPPRGETTNAAYNVRYVINIRK
jgi:hypothetical protein